MMRKRFLLFILALALLPGCGPGPKSAKAAPAVSAAAQRAYDAEFKRLTEQVATLHKDVGADAQLGRLAAERIEGQASAIWEKVDSTAISLGQRIDAISEKLDGLHVRQDLAQATIDALSTPAEPVPQTPADTVAKTFGEIDEALSIEAEPKAAPEESPLPVEPSPPAAAATHLVTVRGARVDVHAFIAANYRGRWSHPGTIDAHLVEHGVKASELRGLSNDDKEKLHSAIHESEGKVVSKSRTVTRGPAPAAPKASSSCPSGNCPAMQAPSYRTGIFGRTRMKRR